VKPSTSIARVLRTWKRRRRALFFPVIAAAVGIAVYAIPAAAAAPGATHITSTPVSQPHPATRILEAPPGPLEFASTVVGTTTAYARAHREATRITNVDCVQASPGHYMCSYAVTRPNRPRECHLMQATWTPNSTSTYAVTLAGRVEKCSTLREALRSLR
jgi:hypothetical protein